MIGLEDLDAYKAKNPWHKFRACWEVQVDFASETSLLRFLVRHSHLNPRQMVMVQLGTDLPYGEVMGRYWELFPINGDTVRYPFLQHEKVTECIDREFKRLLKLKGDPSFRNMGPRW